MTPISVLHANVGQPLVCGPLALFPVFTSGIPADRYRTGPGAARRHTLGVQEAGGGNVPELAVTNTDHRPILLLEGETILGNRQHRTLNVSVLIPAGITLTVPVSCVEQGRWGTAQKARRAGALAPARLRSTKLSTVHDGLGAGGRRDADQGAVWAQVAAYATDHRVNSGTGALEDVHAARALDVDRLAAGSRPLDGQRGVIAAARGRIIGVDLFDKPGTLARYWKALVGAYALDALSEDAEYPDVTAALIDEAEAFLHAALTADGTCVPGVGAGDEIHLRSAGVVGHALVWNGAVVHLSAFPA